MRVAIAGAGAVGRSIAGELVEGKHQVMLIERDRGSLHARSADRTVTRRPYPSRGPCWR